MNQMIETFLTTITAMTSIGDFMELGGPVMWLIALVSLALWILIIERFHFFSIKIKSDMSQFNKSAYQLRRHPSQWMRYIHRAMIADRQRKCFARLSLIKALVVVAPLLGLLGTVTGMIEIFDVIALTGSGNIRAIASGVSRATLPTLAGMVVALSGLYFHNLLERRAIKYMRQYEHRESVH